MFVQHCCVCRLFYREKFFFNIKMRKTVVYSAIFFLQWPSKDTSPLFPQSHQYQFVRIDLFFRLSREWIDQHRTWRKKKREKPFESHSDPHCSITSKMTSYQRIEEHLKRKIDDSTVFLCAPSFLYKNFFRNQYLNQY